MAVELPETIAILGAGPIGLAAALYGRFLGYDVTIYELGRVAENMLRWGHVQLFSPFGMNRSPLGIAAIEAQNPSWQPPADDVLLSGRQYVEQYLLPLAQTDLLRGHLRERTMVIAVGREDCLKADLVGDEDRAQRPFRILLRRLDASPGEEAGQVELADIVIDTTGTYGNHNTFGAAGIPALGEIEALVRVCQAHESPAGIRDIVMIGLLYICGLRRAEVASLNV